MSWSELEAAENSLLQIPSEHEYKEEQQCVWPCVSSFLDLILSNMFLTA